MTMIRRLLPATALAAGLALPASADIVDMTDAEREAFRAEVRDYLLENPEVLMEAIAVLESREAAAGAERDMQLVAVHSEAIFDAPGDLVLGNPDGDVTIVEFMDYRCTYCRRAAPEVTDLLNSDGNIRLVIKEFPILGEQSVLAARFALAARYAVGEEAYAVLHDALMTMRSDMTEGALSRLAGDLGYDGDEILAAMDDPRIDEIITANYDLARALQISGTPTFVLGDQLVRGFVPGEQMAEMVDEVRAATD
ncbi:thioredoxin domain-containing protein [Rhodobacterales bacterium HKCCE3408]|nr:thioredoxin domain-containing protein [Rhodobacterales bacterium HKCCE3408]